MKITEDITLEIRGRSGGGTTVWRCNGKTASCTGNDEYGVARVAEKAILAIAELHKDFSILGWPNEMKELGGKVWTVTYKAPNDKLSV